ncbi:MAG: heme-binding protein [Gammaproteobacteria bacterium]|nr:heme-binding protein [Gammaproteobacteria bacterium]
MNHVAYLFRCLGALCIAIATSMASAEESSTLYTYRTLSVDLASKAAWGAVNDCRKKGYSVAVAVVDRGGNIQALLRDRFAGPHTPETAIRKAWTANSFRQSTSELAGLLEEKRIPSQVSHNPGALLVGGGLTIEAGGEIVGGIGVSGAPPGRSERDSIDGACAKAGIESIREAMEFAE